LIEIGGSFRIPEILSRSNAVLREVGTTNKTRLSDYAAAFNERTRMLLRVHPSNYRVIGFTEAVSLAELAELAHARGVPLVEDAGSGLLQDLSANQITGEPLPHCSLAAGVDLITFSADKLLGGPQAGIIAGRRALVQRIRKNPLMRILRLDKMTLTALEATLNLYLSGQATMQIPVLRMICEKPEVLRRRALNLKRRIYGSAESRWNFELAQLHSAIGGGSCPGVQLISWGLAVSSGAESAVDIERRMRTFDPPIIARIEQDRLLLDMRTLLPGDEAVIAGFFHR
jgi:L-seryl-tRNA(Ser) seleniumtransferase